MSRYVVVPLSELLELVVDARDLETDFNGELSEHVMDKVAEWVGEDVTEDEINAFVEETYHAPWHDEVRRELNNWRPR